MNSSHKSHKRFKKKKKKKKKGKTQTRGFSAQFKHTPWGVKLNDKIESKINLNIINRC